MTRHVVRNPYVTVGGTDLSHRVRSVTVQETVADITDWDHATGRMIYLAGAARTGSVSVEWVLDFDADEIQQTLDPLVGEIVEVVARDDIGMSDRWRFDALVSDVPQLAGTVGELATATTTWQMANSPTVETAPALLWKTNMMVEQWSNTRRGFTRFGDTYGRLTDASVEVGGHSRTLTEIQIRSNLRQMSLRAQSSSHAAGLNGSWLRVDNDDRWTREFEFPSGQSHVDISGIDGELPSLAGSIVPVGVYSHDPRGWGLPDLSADPIKLFETTMTCGTSGGEVGYSAAGSPNGYGSLADHTIHTPDGTVSLSNSAVRIRYDGSLVLTMASAANAQKLHRLWLVMGGGINNEIRFQGGNRTLEVVGTVGNPGWADGTEVGIQLWDQRP